MNAKALPITAGIIFALLCPHAFAEDLPPFSILMAGAAATTITPVDDNGRLWQEPYTDVNGNGRYDAPNPLKPLKPSDPFEDLNQNGKWDGPFLAGFKHQKDYYLATGVHDPLWARTLVLKLGSVKIALVALDLVGLLYPDVERIRREVSGLNFDYVLIASTHTHAGLDSMGLWGPNPLTDGKDPRFMAHIRNQTVQSIRKANDSLKPAKLTLIETMLPKDFGLIIQDRRDPIVIDNRLNALLATDYSGETIAILVNGSPHPETLGGVGGLISSDFPHYLREGLEKGGYSVKGKTIRGWGGIAIYFSGAVGGLLTTLGSDIQDDSGRILPQRSFEKAQRIGELSAWAVTKALKKAEPVKVSGITVDSRRIFFPIDNRYFKYLLEKGVIERPTYTDGKPHKKIGEDLQTEVALITLFGTQRPVTQFIAIPGELFPELVHGGHLTESKKCWAITERKKRMNGNGRERIGAANPNILPEPFLAPYVKSRIYFLLGLANDELGYIVPMNDFVFPRYTPGPKYGVDRCGDDDHYEETRSASSWMAPVLSENLIQMLIQSDTR